MMNLLELEKEIEIIWENRNNINSKLREMKEI